MQMYGTVPTVYCIQLTYHINIAYIMIIFYGLWYHT